MKVSEHLTGAVLPVYATTLTDMLGYTLMMPLLPAVAERYGASNVVAGALLGISAFCSMITAPFWGRVSDRIGRRRVLLFTQAVSLAGYLLLALSHSLMWIFAARIISGVGAGNFAAVQSYIADVTEESEREKAFSLYGVIFGAAFIIGPLAAGIIVHAGLQSPFYLAALLALISLVVTYRYVAPPKGPRPRDRTSAFSAIRRSPIVQRLLARQFLFVFGVVYLLGSFALYLHSGFGYDPSSTGRLLAVAGAVGGAVQAFSVPRLASRIGERAVAQTGFILMAAAYVLFFAIQAAGWFIAVLVLWAIGAAMVAPSIMTLLSEYVPQADRGAVLGFSDALNGVALAAAPTIGTAILSADTHLAGILPAAGSMIAFLIGYTHKAAGETDIAST